MSASDARRPGGEPDVPVPLGVRLAAAMEDHGPLCVGIDPHPQLLRAWGLPVDASGLRTFALTCVEALSGNAAMVKPQSAFFEEYGTAGTAVLEEVLAGFRESGTLTLLDVKRGDIGSTMAAYARAYLSDSSPLRADAITVNPFLGYASLRPAIDLVPSTGRGVFVLALTSNPEGPAVQHAVRDGRSVAGQIVEEVTRDNAPAVARGEMGSIGLVVGATVGGAVRELGLDLAAAGGPLLAPGLGAQGASAEDVRRAFAGATSRVLASSSREVLSAGPSPAAVTDRCRRVADTLATTLRSRPA